MKLIKNILKFPWNAIRENYFTAIEECGGIAIGIPHNTNDVNYFNNMITFLNVKFIFYLNGDIKGAKTNDTMKRQSDNGETTSTRIDDDESTWLWAPPLQGGYGKKSGPRLGRNEAR